MSFGLRIYFDCLVFAFGAVVGSFFNVCIHRMPREESVVRPPSHCPRCNQHIRWFDNIPLFSWVALGGKCRYCKESISSRYLFIELLTAGLFLAVWLKYELSWLAPIYWVLVGGLIVATFIDFEHYIIPDEITYGGVVAGLALSAACPALHEVEIVGGSILQSLLGALAGGMALYAVVEAGKLAFGRLHISLPPQSQIAFADGRIGYDLPAFTERSKVQTFGFALLTISRDLFPWVRILRRCFLTFMHNRCPAVRFPRAHEEVKLTDVFSRDSDRITFFAKKVNCGEREFNNVRVSVSLANITIGEERLELETVGTVSANADVITLPREAMGMGDVKFLAGIGAFLGWGGALFTIFASSLIGGLIGLTLVAVGNRGWGRRLPYGPYLALGALVWVFGGSGLLNWYIQFLRG